MTRVSFCGRTQIPLLTATMERVMSNKESKYHMLGGRTHFDNVQKLSNQAETHTQSDSWFYSTATDSFAGTTNPHWRDQVRYGGNATTPASGTKYLVKEYEYLSWAIKWVDDGSRLSGFDYSTQSGYGVPPYSFPAIASTPADVVADTNNRAIRKFLDAADQARSSVEAGQDFAEWRETIHGLHRPMDSMRKLTVRTLMDLKKRLIGRRLKRLQFLKAVADSYLEWTFGWAPLAKDIEDAVVGLQTRLQRPQIVSIRASAKGIGRVTEVTGFTVQGPNYARRFQSQVRGSYYRRLKGGIRTGAVNGAIGRKQVLQLDAAHFASTVWDIIPYSFVADYFVNIGDIIEAMSFRIGNLSWGCDTTLIVNEAIFRDVSFDANSIIRPHMNIISSRWAGGNARLQTRTFTRNPITSQSLVPSFRFNLPISSKPWENLGFLTLARAANAAISAEYRRFK